MTAPEDPPALLGMRPAGLVSRYGFAVLSFAVALSIRLLLAPIVGGRPVLVLFVSAVLFSAIFAGLGPAILATGFVLTYDAVLKLRADSLAAADVVNTLAFCIIVVEIYWVTEHWARQRRSAEEHLADTEDFFDHILNALPNAVLVTDRMGKILKRNRSCEATLGIPMGRIEGRNIEEFLPADFLSRVYTSDGGAKRWVPPREPTVILQRHGETVLALAIQVKEIQQADGPVVLVWSMHEIEDLTHGSELGSETAVTPGAPKNSGGNEEAPDQALIDLRARYRLLSERERQVLERLVAGESNREIGLALRISPRTVESHRAHIMTKMEAASFPDLVQMAFRLTQLA